MRNILFVFVLGASATHAYASSPATSIHVANASDRILSIWINGDVYDLSPASGIVFPCIENERHTVQTESEVMLLNCGDSVEVGQ